MLNESELDTLAGLVASYGAGDVVEGLVQVLQKLATTGETSGAAFGHDAIALRRVVPRLWAGHSKRKGRGT